MKILLPFRLFRYILQEALPYIILTLFALTILILAQQLSKQSDILLGSASSTILSLRLISFLLPGILIITLPFALLIGSLIALNRLSADSEIMSCRASGIDLVRITHPFITLALIGVAITLYFTTQIIPSLLGEAKAIRTKLLLEILAAPMKSQTFITQFSKHLIYIQQIEKETGDWLGVFIVRKEENANKNLVLTANRGRLLITNNQPLTLEISLTDGLLLSSENAENQKQSITSFAHQAIKINSENPTISQIIEKARNTQELSLSQLKTLSDTATSQQERRQALTEWHKRFSLPFACLVLTLLAVPLGLSSARASGRVVAFAIGFTVAVLYYLTLLGGQNLALAGTLPPWLGVWLPNLLGLATTVLISRYQNSFSLQNSFRLPFKLNKHQLNKAVLVPVPNKRRTTFLTLTNYLLVSEFIKYFLLSSIILIFTSLIFTLFDLLPSLNRSGLGWSYAGAYLLFLAPQIYYYTAPFSFLIALLTTYSILSRSNQITALLTSGINPLRLATPLAASAFITTLGLFWVSETILPKTNLEQDTRYNRIKGRKNEQSTMALGLHWVRSENDIIYSFEPPKDNNILINTTAYSLSGKNGRLLKVADIYEATPVTPYSWHVKSGHNYTIDKDGGIQVATFRVDAPMEPENLLKINEGVQLFRRVVNEAAKMSFLELRSYMRYLDNLGGNVVPLRVELEKKLAFPFSVFSLAAIALPFTIKSRRRGTLVGIGVSILVGFSYWIMASVFEGLGKQAFLPPGLSVWGLHALFITIGIFLFFRHSK